ncbi:MAG: ribonuclease HI [Flavobacteriaceae bacterium]|nr:ribonuclease HI [Flavobacteriaceae bacterium]
MIHIYTDGACSGNPGPGGYAAILTFKGSELELSAGYRLTTNNRMELLACIVGLEAIKNEGHEVSIVSDSKYVCDSVTKGWLFGWLKKDFKGKKNPDLWKRFYAVYQKHKVKMVWVKGHAGHPMNERCDQLAVIASQNKKLLTDTEFERTGSDTTVLF